MSIKSELKKQTLLNELNDSEIEKLSKIVSQEFYPKGKTIFKEGDPTKGIYMIHKGKVEISKTTPDGWKQALAVLKEGNFFGELSLIEDKKNHGAHAVALENTELFLIKKEDFKELEKSDTLLMYKIMKTIAKVASRNLHSMNEKLIKLLISY
ncbi:MAG: cyclic nucleotide-binding domain-containing protein [Thermodesulfovibrionales bacterium]|nr:cyclic nucleotide-binding domain-containing protein [Thermodesulfovibrionales bacterium]